MTEFREGATYKVLLVDHQQETSRNTAFLLQLAGYEVTTAGGLDEAINIVSIFCPEGETPDVILMDNLNAAAERNGVIELFAKQFKNSRILMINRAERQNRQRKADCRIIAPRHLLGGIRQVLAERATVNDDCDNFCRFHSYV